MSKAPNFRRRWFRFSLRTLFVAMTVVALLFAWLGWNVHRKRERQLLFTGRGVLWSRGDMIGYWENMRLPSGLPFGLKLVGEQYWSTIELGGEKFTEDDLQRYKAAFPEAIVTLRAPRTGGEGMGADGGGIGGFSEPNR